MRKDICRSLSSVGNGDRRMRLGGVTRVVESAVLLDGLGVSVEVVHENRKTHNRVFESGCLEGLFNGDKLFAKDGISTSGGHRETENKLHASGLGSFNGIDSQLSSLLVSRSDNVQAIKVAEDGCKGGLVVHVGLDRGDSFHVELGRVSHTSVYFEIASMTRDQARERCLPNVATRSKNENLGFSVGNRGRFGCSAAHLRRLFVVVVVVVVVVSVLFSLRLFL